MSTPTLAIRTAAAGLLLGILGAVLTFQRQIGLGYTLAGLALLAGLFLFARIHRIQPVWRNMIMLIPALFFMLMLVIRSDPSLTLMNIFAALVALLLTVYFFRKGNLLNLGFLEYPINMLSSGIAVCTKPFAELALSFKWLAAYRDYLPFVGPVLRGAVITLPVVAVFVVLLSAADEVFSRLVGDVLQLFTLRNAGNLTQQSLYTGGLAWLAIGLLAVALAERKAKRAPQKPANDAELDEESESPAPAAPAFSMGFIESMMVLVSICAIFAAFVMIQFVYLFGGERNITNFSYAEYVHRGFIELVIVAVLTLGLALTLNVITIRRTSAHANMVRWLCTALILLTGVILASAFERLRLYELTYGLTSLRLLIYVFIGWLGFTFAGFTLSLYWSRPAINVFSVTALIAVFGMAGTLDILNPDYFVAWQNIQRGDVDPLHFSLLSEEAAPALVTLVDAPEPGLRRIVRSTLATYINRVNQPGTDWRDFNLDRSSVQTVLGSVQDRLDAQHNSAAWEHPLAEFSTLRSGMTVRETVRQFGVPLAGSDAAIYGEFSSENNSLSLTYLLDDESSLVDLRFDSATGLNAACVRPRKPVTCSPLPLGH